MFAYCVFFVLACSSCIQAGTVLDVLSSRPEYSVFLGWLSDETKNDLGGKTVLLTVFIPTNETALKFLKTHPMRADMMYWLGSIAEHCVVHGDLDLAQLKEKDSVDTGEHLPKLWINRKNESIYINNAKVTNSLAASNGHVHELDAVIYPIGFSSTLKEEIDVGDDYSGFKSLVAKVEEARNLLDNTTARFTVFSPNSVAVTDDIKAKNHTQLLQIIRRHVVRNQVVFSPLLIGQSTPLPSLEQNETIDVKYMDNEVFVGISGYWSMVESVDVSSSNGVLHVRNGILGVSSGVNLYQALGLFDPSKFGATLHVLMNSTELRTDFMDTTKRFTVLSPQNAAWDDVSTSNITTLEKLFKHHVIMGKLTLDELINQTVVRSLSGEKLVVKKENNNVYLKFHNIKAEVISTDNLASNGIIHAINKVLRTTKPKADTNIETGPAFWSYAIIVTCIGLFTCACALFLILQLRRLHHSKENYVGEELKEMIEEPFK